MDDSDVLSNYMLNQASFLYKFLISSVSFSPSSIFLISLSFRYISGTKYSRKWPLLTSRGVVKKLVWYMLLQFPMVKLCFRVIVRRWDTWRGWRRWRRGQSAWRVGIFYAWRESFHPAVFVMRGEPGETDEWVDGLPGCEGLAVLQKNVLVVAHITILLSTSNQ